MTLLAGSAVGGLAVSALPAEVPAATRARLAAVTDRASVVAEVDGEPFRARREIFEYLIDHPAFATQLTQMLRVARYRVWKLPDGFGLDDGWGTLGTFQFVYVAPGVRVLHAQGAYQQSILPTIRGQAIITIRYASTATADGASTIAATVGTVVRLDGKLMLAAGRLASASAHAKAEKEGRRLVKVFARTTHAIEEHPAAVYEALRQRPDVPRHELEEFRRLLSLPTLGATPPR